MPSAFKITWMLFVLMLDIFIWQICFWQKSIWLLSSLTASKSYQMQFVQMKNVKFRKTIFLRTFVCYLVQIFAWKYQSKFSFLLGGGGWVVEDSLRTACCGQKNMLIEAPALQFVCTAQEKKTRPSFSCNRGWRDKRRNCHLEPNRCKYFNIRNKNN